MLNVRGMANAKSARRIIMLTEKRQVVGNEMTKEKKVKKKDLPRKVYHLVPIKILKKYTNLFGTYDPRNKPDFGNNSPFIHTTPSVKQINKHLPYLKQIKDRKFSLLEIDVLKLDSDKITYNKFNGQTYHHLWFPLKKSFYTKRIVSKNRKGEIK